MSGRAQLTLPLELAPSHAREDFLVGRPNEAAFDYITRWPRWLSPAAMLSGPPGSGKSHLAAIFAAEAGAPTLRGDHLTFGDIPRLALARALVIEDCDRFPPPETALFHLFNLARETGLSLVLTARKPPDAWGIATPDLLSRLRAQPLLALAEPDDALLAALYVKLFADRQIRVDERVIAMALARGERSYAGAAALVGALDERSLALKRPVTRALVAELLGAGPAGEADEPEFDFPG